jgi:hypothetical protein
MELLEEIESLGDFVIEPLNLDASQTRDLFARKIRGRFARLAQVLRRAKCARLRMTAWFQPDIQAASRTELRNDPIFQLLNPGLAGCMPVYGIDAPVDNLTYLP